jgi:sporulation protein YlmC with PRC-barrel domain
MPEFHTNNSLVVYSSIQNIRGTVDLGPPIVANEAVFRKELAMNARGTIPLVVCTAVLLLARLGAADTVAPAAVDQGQMGQMQGTILRASPLIGTSVFNPQGQKLGQIKEILFDSQTGLVNLVVLDANVAGTGRASIVVPYSILRASTNVADNRQSFMLDLRPDQLRMAPRIENNQWETIRSPQFLEQVRNFYQPREYTAARPIESASAPAPVLQYAAPPQPCFDIPYGSTPTRDDDAKWNDHS